MKTEDLKQMVADVVRKELKDNNSVTKEATAEPKRVVPSIYKNYYCKDCNTMHSNPHYNPNDRAICDACADDEGNPLIFPASWKNCPNCGDEVED
ncbi:MAG: hypothetical protein ACE5J2_05855 [Nitrososphaerales archaeon]